MLVIGGAGYLGSVVVRELLGRGYTVRLLDKFIYGDESVRELYGHDRFNTVVGDFRDLECVVAAMNGVNAVIHLGAIVGDPACGIDERQTILTNLAATRMIAEVARGFGVRRLLFASTCSVYGTGDHWLNETSDLNPVSLYGKTKVQAEQLLQNLGNERFCPTVLRIATLYGMSPRPRFDLVINLLAAMARFEKHITVFGGEQWRPFIHVADAARGFVDVLAAPADKVCGEVFNLGTTGQNYQIQDVAQLIAAAVPDVVVECRGELTDPRNYRVCFDKLKRTLGFAAHYTVAAGIDEVVQAIDQGLVTNYRLARYNNYRFLSDETQRARIQLQDSIFSYDIANDGLTRLLGKEEPRP